MANVLMIIAPEKFRDEELFYTKEELENIGHNVVIASRKASKITGMLGGTAEAKISTSDVKTKDYEAVVFVGGSGAAEYFSDKIVQKIAREMNNDKKIVAAICIAPTILANAGVLKGRKATCFQSEHENLEDNSVKYTGRNLEVDGNIITANGPESARIFGKKIAELLKKIITRNPDS
ncbi:Intracellular protease 1 [Candidatus Tiddalikarchaeum anstoanum]|nr:Intracellular protease 1 [Candidatus Tiddalikarchaeum anstoanum]